MKWNNYAIIYIVAFLSIPFSIVAQKKNTTGQSLFGFSGLIYTPSAYTSDWGAIYFGHTHYDRNIEITPHVGRDNRVNGNLNAIAQRSHWTHIGFLPFAEISLKLTKGYNLESTEHGLGDRSISFRLQVVKETGKWPAVTIGLIDPFIEVPVFAANYVVTSKSYRFKEFQVIGNLGYGLDVFQQFDSNTLVGIFGGIQTNWKNIKLNIEYDTERINIGTGYNFKNWLFLDAALVDLKYFSGSIHAKFLIK